MPNTNVWIKDADYIDFNDMLDTAIYRTSQVQEYLEGNKLGVAALRGVGKTFLMKAKRQIEQNKQGVICLPTDQMVDSISEIVLDPSSKGYLEDYANWPPIWKSAILISLFSACLKEEREEFKMCKLPKAHASILKQRTTLRLSQAFIDIIGQSAQVLGELRAELPSLLPYFTFPRNDFSFFIDKIDQTFSVHVYKHLHPYGPINPDYWIFAQLSIAEASYDIYSNQNKHIKVFFSIRKTALRCGSKYSYKFQNFEQGIQQIEYTKNQMLEMIDQYIVREKAINLSIPEEQFSNPFKAFLGVDSIPHRYVINTEEKAFDYIYRHTLGKPRDLMYICNKLCEQIPKLKNGDIEHAIRECVNTASVELLNNFLEEISIEPLFYNLKPNHVETLCKLIPSNYLNIRVMNDLCSEFNKEQAKDVKEYIEINFCRKKCEECDNMHPFCQLYNIGLIGYLDKNRDGIYKIRYHSFDDGIIGLTAHSLPVSDLYFMHPALSNIIEKTRKLRGDKYNLANIIISENTFITEKNKSFLLRKNNSIAKHMPSRRVFISSTCRDLHDERIALAKLLNHLGYKAICSDADDFDPICINTHSHDHCIHEMQKCNYVIFILSGRYGQKYIGSEFLQILKEKLVNFDQLLINPSVTLAEFIMARIENKTILVLFNEKIVDERDYYNNSKKKNVEMPLKRADNINIFDFFSYVTRQLTVNWIVNYRDLNDLLNIVKLNFKT